MSKKNYCIRKSVFIPSFSIVLGAGILGLINNAIMINGFRTAFEWTYSHMSWLFQLAAAGSLVVVAAVMFSRCGSIRIGGENAKPRYKLGSWFAMSLTGGMSAGLVSSAISQPVIFLQNLWRELDGYGIPAQSTEAVLFAFGRTLHEWSFIPYSFYGICGITIAYLCFNRQKPVSISSNLIPLFGDRITNSRLASVIDIVSVLSLALATVGTLGSLITLFTLCFKNVYHIQPTLLLMFTIMLVTTVIYLLSSLSGVDKGIQFFAKLNARFYYGLMLVVLLAGGSVLFTLNVIPSSLGYWADHFSLWALDTGMIGGPALVKWWTIYSWAFWIAYAPTTGVFLAQISYGRTLREFLFVNWILPSLFIIVWFGIWGGSAVNWQLSGAVDLAGIISRDGAYAGIWLFLQNLPLARLLIPIVLFTMLISYTTGADNCITVMSALCVRNRKIGDEAPASIKLAWGIPIGLLAFLLMAFAAGTTGNDGVRYMVVAVGSLLLIYFILHIAAAVKLFFFDIRKKSSFKTAQTPDAAFEKEDENA